MMKVSNYFLCLILLLITFPSCDNCNNSDNFPVSGRVDVVLWDRINDQIYLGPDGTYLGDSIFIKCLNASSYQALDNFLIQKIEFDVSDCDSDQSSNFPSKTNLIKYDDGIVDTLFLEYVVDTRSECSITYKLNKAKYNQIEILNFEFTLGGYKININ